MKIHFRLRTILNTKELFSFRQVLNKRIHWPHFKSPLNFNQSIVYCLFRMFNFFFLSPRSWGVFKDKTCLDNSHVLKRKFIFYILSDWTCRYTFIYVRLLDANHLSIIHFSYFFIFFYLLQFTQFVLAKTTNRIIMHKDTHARAYARCVIGVYALLSFATLFSLGWLWHLK